ncbi:MAG: Gfo/Idh/MocA family protein [Candidatus Brocadiia bacterium]
MAIKVAFVGAGGIAGFHLGHLEKIEDVEVVGFADAVREKAEARAKQVKARPYSDHRRMLDATKPDAVYVCTPPFAHGDFELDAIERACHLFVEKPIATSMDTAEEIRRAIRNAGVLSAVGYQDRYQDIIATLRKILRQRTPATAMGYWMGGMPGVPWWRVKARSGGQHTEQTTHIFDMMRYLFGEVRSVFAAASTGLMTDVPNYDVEDVSAVTLTFKDGMVATVHSACCLKGGGKVGIDIYCTDAVLEYVERRSLTLREPHHTEEFTNETDFGQVSDEVFIDAIRTGGKTKRRVKSTYADACKSLALSLAADKSMATGEVVEL